MRLAPVVLLCLLLGGPIYAPSAWAQTPSEEAKSTFKLAQDHYLAMRYTEALPLFQQVYAETKSPNALLYVARCYERLGKPVEAYKAYRQTVAEAREKAKTDVRFSKTVEATEEELTRAGAKVAIVTVVVSNAPEGLVVEINGAALSNLDEETIVPPGRVRVDARAPGFDPIRHDLEVSGGVRQQVALRFEPPTPPPPPPPPVLTETGGEVRIAGYVVGGLGVLGFVAFMVAGINATTTFSDIEDRCGDGPCTKPSDQEDIDSGRASDLAANISVGIGSGLLAAGVLMIIFGGPTEVDATATPDGGWLSWRTRF